MVSFGNAADDDFTFYFTMSISTCVVSPLAPTERSIIKATRVHSVRFLELSVPHGNIFECVIFKVAANIDVVQSMSSFCSASINEIPQGCMLRIINDRKCITD